MATEPDIPDFLDRRPKANAPDSVLAEHAQAIRTLGKRVIGDVIEIGQRLTDAKARIGHGGWLPWLDREFGWTEQTALNFMRCHDLAKSKNFGDLALPISGLYLLAAPSTPDQARDEIIDRAQAGESVSVSDIKHTIDSAKGRKQPARKTAKPRTPKQDPGAAAETIERCRRAFRAKVRKFKKQTPPEEWKRLFDVLQSDLQEIAHKAVVDAIGIARDERKGAAS